MIAAVFIGPVSRNISSRQKYLAREDAMKTNIGRALSPFGLVALVGSLLGAPVVAKEYPVLRQYQGVVAQAVLGPNLVQNASFETPDVSAVTFDVYSPGASFGGWSVETGSVDHISQRYWQSAQGRQSVDLSGSIGSVPGAISQHLAPEVGRTYLVRFALAGNPEGGPAVKQVQVWWGTTLLDTLSINTTGRSNWAMGWNYYQYSILNLDALVKLTFKSMTPGHYGPVVDAISVQAYDGSLPLLDLPVDYWTTNEKFAAVAVGNTGENPGRVNSWLDHTYPDYTKNHTVTIWSGAVYTSPNLADLDDHCEFGINCYNGHNGIDFQYQYLSTGATEYVYPAATGSVVEVFDDWPHSSGSRGSPYGNYVLIDHGGGYASFYAHLASVNPLIGLETEITSTRAITVGVMGGTGGWPIHLHFGLYYDANHNGTWEESYSPAHTEVTDPYGWFGSGADPWTNTGPYLWKHPLWDAQTVNNAGAVLVTPSGRARVTVPAAAFTTPIDLALWDTTLPAPAASGRLIIGHGVSLSVANTSVDPQELPTLSATAFASPVTINLGYAATETEHANPSQLGIFRWEASTTSWTPLTSTVNTQVREVTAQTSEPGVFAILAPLTCAADFHEPDDDFYSAPPLASVGQTIRQVFDGTSDEDWVAFDASAGMTYAVHTSALASGVNTVLELYDRDGITRLASNDNVGSTLASALNWRAPRSGRFFIRVDQAAGSAAGCQASYALTLQPSFQVFLPNLTK
jgi:choice-of-anchor C domain-containing protein